MDDTPPPPDSKLTATKQQWARDGRGLTGGQPAPRGRRLPPGQRLTSGLPVLDLGTHPVITPEDWRFTVAGLVDRPLAWDWAAFMAQPQVTVTVDIHCVTTWSSYDNRFTGVSTRHLLDLIGPRPTASHLMARSSDGYSTNLPLTALAAPDALLAHSWNGQPLDRAHGGPVRLLIPHLYFWKSAKWLRHLTILDRDQPGYWEARGYHMNGDPWTEERYD